MWRKSRSRNSVIPYCVGVDPNRNFGFHHAEVGASKNPCSEVYAGPTPFSEPEVAALAEFVKRFDDIKLYLSFHAYGLLLLFPYVSGIRCLLSSFFQCCILIILCRDIQTNCQAIMMIWYDTFY